jgi:hypothetical protein
MGIIHGFEGQLFEREGKKSLYRFRKGEGSRVFDRKWWQQ